MNGSRLKLFAAVSLAALFVVVMSRAFIGYEPPLPSNPEFDPQASQQPAGSSDPRASRTSSSDNELAQDRIRRLQAVIRTQRSELSSLRSQTPQAKPAARKPRKKPDLLSRLPDLSLLSSLSASDMSKEDLQDQLSKLRDITIELKDQLESAETVVEMQSSEIDDLQEEIDTVRDRLSVLTDERSETDDVLEEMLAESRDIERAARSVLVELGPPAVAMLLTLSDDDRAHVRQWVREVIAVVTRDENEDPAP